MADDNTIQNNTDNDVISANDPLDINELASLNEEISNEFIDQLQNQISQSSNIKNDGELFEETMPNETKEPAAFNDDIDDNFIKKYKAKLQKQQNPSVKEDDYELKSRSTPEVKESNDTAEIPVADSNEESIQVTKPAIDNIETPKAAEIDQEDTVAESNSEITDTPQEILQSEPPKSDIESVSGGNIIEKPITKENVEYNESLDMLDNNVKYSKYVIYIDPENKDFIDSLTVKERKNLINRIIKEQDSITVSKRRFSNMQMFFAHAIVAIITFAIAIPCIYWTINASLEATINNYRASQVVFGKLYREHGKIKTNANIR